LLNSENNFEQKLVDKRFDAESPYWRDVYQRKDIFGIIYQQRMTIALNYIEELSLPENAHILEIGCGAGFVSIALARIGFLVDSVDHAPSMIALTQRHASQAGVGSRIHTAVEDVHNLNFEDRSFDLIVALGVVPWLHDLRKALFEITRVLVPDGHAVLNMYNRDRLNSWVDVPTLLRGKAENILETAGLRDPLPPCVARGRSYSIKEFGHYLDEANLTRIKDTCIGFGPFRLFGHNILSDPVGIKVHQRLQRYADNGYLIIRSSGSQYVVLARKREQQH
jgi:ubiquinone/menaquinone biosynthesis C-methylase UbiE